MNFFNLTAILIVISALFAYINFRFVRLPSVIGVMLVSILVSLGLILADLLGLGGGAYWLLRSIDNYQVEILLALALVIEGYALAITLNTSGPTTVVVAGLLVGNQGREFAMSDQTRERLTMFWELVDEILNPILFVLIGVELLAVTFAHKYILAGLAAIPIALASRYGSLALPKYILRLGGLPGGALKIMTWGGLRGGIAVALALSLPLGQERNLILTMTYIVVVFSIVVQSLTLKYVATWDVLNMIQSEMIMGRFRRHESKPESDAEQRKDSHASPSQPDTIRRGGSHDNAQ